MTDSKKLYDTVIKNGYCIGCGTCTSIPSSPFSIKLDQFGNYVAEPNSDNLLEQDVQLLDVCPFSDNSKDEDELSSIYLHENSYTDDKIGKYSSCYAGHVKHGDYRKRGSSGGFIKWFASKLMEQGKIDYFIQLSTCSKGANSSFNPLFEYKTFNESEGIINGSKSAYYPATLNDVIKVIRENEGAYAITGVPCFIKALRLISEKESVVKDRLKYTFGIICGGMKSANQSKMIGWQLGILPNDLSGIDFRRKYSNRPADQKIYQVWSKKDNKERYQDSSQIYGTDYGAGFFKPKACDYCDDVVAETADVSVGDAWLKDYSKDPKGNSLIIVRNRELQEIIDGYLKRDELCLDAITSKDVVIAQAGGFRHRREGLSYRLKKKSQINEWYPPKRVSLNKIELTEKRKLIYDLREKIAAKSHLSFRKALNNNDLNVFFREMSPLVSRYQSLNEVSKLRLILRKLKRVFIYDVLRRYS